LWFGDNSVVRRFTVAGWSDIVAAREQETLGPVERVGDTHRVIDDPHLAAGVQHRLPIVLELATLDDGDERHSYIRIGTSMPISSSARVSCALKYATPAARHRLRAGSSSLSIG